MHTPTGLTTEQLEFTMATNSTSSLSRVLDRVNLVVYQTRIVTPIRDTGEGRKVGSRIEKVLQACFDPAALRPLARKKQEANRICRIYGSKVETLNAWAVPLERTQELVSQLAQISKDWDGMADTLASSMVQTVDSWASANPSEADTIRALAPSAEEVRATTRFIFTTFRLSADQVVDDNGCLEQDLLGLSGQALREFTQVLRDASLHNTGRERSYYSQQSKDVLSKIAAKAASLAFLDPVLAEISKVLTSTIDMLPPEGQITDAHAVLVKSVIDQLMNPSELMRNGFRKIAPKAVQRAPVSTVEPNAASSSKPSGEQRPISRPTSPVASSGGISDDALTW